MRSRVHSRQLLCALALLLAACDGKPAPSEPASAATHATVPAEDSPAAKLSQPTEPRLAEAESLLARWLEAQNSGDFAGYERLYAAKMSGLKRAASRTYRFNRKAWLADRKRMFAHPQKVSAEDVKIVALPGGSSVTFTQRYDSAGFSDRGKKRLSLSGKPGKLHIVSEEMLNSSVVSDQRATAAHGFYFVVHADRPYVLLEQGVDGAWAVEHPHPSYVRIMPRDQANEWPVYVTRFDVSSSLPRDKQALLGRQLQVWNDAGKSCDVRIDELTILAALTPAYELEMQWTGTPLDDDPPDLKPWTDAQVADSIGGWAAQYQGLALAAPLHGCDGDFALDQGRSVRVLGAFEAASEPMTEQAQKLAHASEVFKALQAQQDQGNVDDASDRRKTWYRREDANVLRGQPLRVVLRSFADGMVFSLFAQKPDGMLSLESMSQQPAFGTDEGVGRMGPHLLIDLDQDGSVELLTGISDFHGRTLVPMTANPQPVDGVHYADLACHD